MKVEAQVPNWSPLTQWEGTLFYYQCDWKSEFSTWSSLTVPRWRKWVASLQPVKYGSLHSQPLLARLGVGSYVFFHEVCLKYSSYFLIVFSLLNFLFLLFLFIFVFVFVFVFCVCVFLERSLSRRNSYTTIPQCQPFHKFNLNFLKFHYMLLFFLFILNMSYCLNYIISLDFRQNISVSL